MNYVLFVNTQYIKDNSPIMAYVSDDELLPFIKIGQDIHLQRVLGTNLLKDLQARYTTLNADEIILMEEYIQPSVCWSTLYEYALYSHYKMTNKGIQTQNSDNSTAADMKDVNFVRDDVRSKFEYFQERLTKYLLANQPKFPMYWGGTTDVSTIVPKYNNYYSGIYTGSKRNGYNNGSKICPDCPIGPSTWVDYNI